MDKKPWVGHWWWCNSYGSTAIVKQDGNLKTPEAYERSKAETTWIFLNGISHLSEEIEFFEPGMKAQVATIPIKEIPLPPVEYLDEGTHEFELTENSYILYD